LIQVTQRRKEKGEKQIKKRKKGQKDKVNNVMSRQFCTLAMF